MKAELINITTKDGIVLTGALYEACPEKAGVILLPGAGMNFYSGLGRFLPQLLAEHGYSCLSANHRGHDYGSAPDIEMNPVMGLIRDRFYDCPLDISCLSNFMYKRGCKNIYLAGHSQASPKILYAIKETELAGIQGIILISPPPSVDRMLRFLVGDAVYYRFYDKMQELARQGKKNTVSVLHNGKTVPYIFSTSTFLELYSPDSPTDILRLVQHCDYPLLAIRGSNDMEPISAQLLQGIKAMAKKPDDCSVEEIYGADHLYKDYGYVLGDIIVRWLDNRQV